MFTRRCISNSTQGRWNFPVYMAFIIFLWKSHCPKNLWNALPSVIAMNLSLFSLGGSAITQCDLNVCSLASGQTERLYTGLKTRAVWPKLTFTGITQFCTDAWMFTEASALLLNTIDVLNYFIYQRLYLQESKIKHRSF